MSFFCLALILFAVGNRKNVKTTPKFKDILKQRVDGIIITGMRRVFHWHIYILLLFKNRI